MKNLTKVAAIAAFMLVSANASAQFEAKQGDITTEVQFNPFSNNFNTFRLKDGIQLKGRYFLTPQDAVRVKLGLGINSTNDVTKNSLTDDFDSKKPVYSKNYQEIETNNKSTQFQFALGYERHFMKEGRLDVYAGAELGYESLSYSGDVTTTINNDVMTGTTGNTIRTQTQSTRKDEFEKQSTDGANINSNNLFAGLFTGFDFYIYKGLYVGTELGIRFTTGKSIVNPTQTTSFNETITRTTTTGSTGVTMTQKTDWNYNSETGIRSGNVVTVAGTTTTENKIETAAPAIDRESKSTGLNFYIEPALRLGWKF